MPYITREDGEHFVIPSYRDVLSAKQKSVLKRDINLLSQNYGEYITLQRKNVAQYEVAFSPDPGYLLGESIWQYFKRPMDMVYCEAIPNTTEAILVIVKDGSVYLDGSFPLETIPEELVIFLTQENNFEIYTYGDVPISQTPAEGKFSFETTSVKSFTVLDKPIFPTLPLLKIYRLQLVDVVLRSQGIGVFPTGKLVLVIVFLGSLWFIWTYFLKPAPPPPVPEQVTNPYVEYNIALSTPAPDQEIQQVLAKTNLLFSMPGWIINNITYAKNMMAVSVRSTGGKAAELIQWARINHANMDVKQDGVYITIPIQVPNRPLPKIIYPLNQVLGTLIDRIATVYPGNHLKMNELISKGSFTTTSVDITLDGIAPSILALIGNQLKDLPVNLEAVKISYDKGSFFGNISIDVFGN